MTNEMLLDKQVRSIRPWPFVAAAGLPQLVAVLALLGVQGGLPDGEAVAGLWPVWALILGYAVVQGLLWWDGTRRSADHPVVMAFSRALLPVLAACVALRQISGGIAFIPLLLAAAACGVMACAIVVAMNQPRLEP
jgi:hypothetical protein